MRMRDTEQAIRFRIIKDIVRSELPEYEKTELIQIVVEGDDWDYGEKSNSCDGSHSVVDDLPFD